MNINLSLLCLLCLLTFLALVHIQHQSNMCLSMLRHKLNAQRQTKILSIDG